AISEPVEITYTLEADDLWTKLTYPIVGVMAILTVLTAIRALMA
ncbi:hypothetical protein KIPB_010958, partial [Kipferlia bialata]